MHSNHGDIHEIGLADGCQDCLEHAEAPWLNLDSDMLTQLIKRNYFYRFNNDLNASTRYSPRSETEAIAMANITNVMERMGRLMENDPQNLIQSYLEHKWHIYFEER